MVWFFIFRYRTKSQQITNIPTSSRRDKLALFCPAVLVQKGGILKAFCPIHISSSSSTRRIPKIKQVGLKGLVSPLICSGAVLGVKIALQGVTHLGNKEKKKIDYKVRADDPKVETV